MIRLASLTFIVLWSTGFVGAKLGMPYAEPASFLFVRCTIVFLLLSTFVFFMGSKFPSKFPRGRQFVDMMIVGILIHGVHLGGVFWAVRYNMPAGIAAVIIGTQPLLTGLLARYWVGDRLSPYHWYGIALGLVGLVLALGINIFTFDAGVLSIDTIIACIISVFAIAIATVYQKLRAVNVDLLSGISVQFLGAALFTFAFALTFESFHIEWNESTIFAMGWLVLVLSIACTFLFMWLIRQGSVSQVASLFYLVPPTGALMTWGLFNEQLTLLQIFGFILCSIAVFLASIKHPIGEKN